VYGVLGAPELVQFTIKAQVLLDRHELGDLGFQTSEYAFSKDLESIPRRVQRRLPACGRNEMGVATLRRRTTGADSVTSMEERVQSGLEKAGI